MAVLLLTLFPSKLATSLSSSMAIFNWRADLCLRAFKNVSGWNNWLKLIECFNNSPYYERYAHLRRALAFLFTITTHSFGFSGPSHYCYHVIGTPPFSNSVASFSLLGVSISTPYKILVMVVILSLTIARVSLVFRISMKTKASTGSFAFNMSCEIYIL